MKNDQLRYFKIEQILETLSERNSLRIFEFLSRGDMGIDVISKTLSIDTSNVCECLSKLVNADVVEIDRWGDYVYYKVKDGYAVPFLELMKRVEKDCFSRF